MFHHVDYSFHPLLWFIYTRLSCCFLPPSFLCILPTSSQGWSCFGSSEPLNAEINSIYLFELSLLDLFISAPRSHTALTWAIFVLVFLLHPLFSPCFLLQMTCFSDLDQSWTVFKKILLIRFSYLFKTVLGLSMTTFRKRRVRPQIGCL